MRNALAIVFLIAGMSIAHAGDLVSLGRPGAEMVFVWKNPGAFKRAVEAIRDGRHREALAYAACVVPVGTPAIVLAQEGFAAKRVLLQDGCAGMVTDEDLNG